MDRGGATRLAFVPTRYGEGFVGGSEAVMGEAARGLAARGYDVEVLTTTALSHYTWENALPAGTSEDRGVVVRRFRTAVTPLTVAQAEREHRVLHGPPLSVEEEISWVNGRFRVPDLYFYLSGHAEEYDAIVFSPYLFWSTIYGASVAPERSVIMPCLHDEPYARLRVVSDLLANAAGLWFLSEPEHQLAHRVTRWLPPAHAVVGAAVQAPASYDPEGFRERHGLTRPFVIYAGRREEGKGWTELLRAFTATVLNRHLPFDLVTFGAGDPNIPERLRSRVIDLGFLPDEEVPNALAAAEALINPSVNESFSRTTMEAWLAGTLVLASAASDVLVWHCERSGGGLTYVDDYELGEVLTFLAESPKAAAAIADRGRDYVLSNYTWDLVLDRMERALEILLGRS
jgi:glycosyltransferase involved in cell wall biosynthesis